MTHESKSFPARVECLDAANAFVEACYDRFGLDAAKKFNVLLALEEAFVNICHYAYPDAAGDVDISCDVEQASFILEVADRGSSFDVLSLPDPDTSLGIEARPVGGLGIFLIRTLAHPTYRRDNGKNILRMVFTT